MTAGLSVLCLLLTAGCAPVDTRFVQEAPAPDPARPGEIIRSVQRDRAVVLIEGLRLAPFHRSEATRAELRKWQEPGGVLVRTLAGDSDVFAFAYGQTTSVADIAGLPALGDAVARLHQAGYTEIVLVGFSAGGLVARQFVEDNPDSAVTRVIQVCAPNAGSPLATVEADMDTAQGPFLRSLAGPARARWLEERRGKHIPAGVEFVCVVGDGLVYGDGVVSTHSQWPEDLQRQGVPAAPLGVEHWSALRDERAAWLIARLIVQNQPRWDAEQVDAMRKRLWGAKKAVLGMKP